MRRDELRRKAMAGRGPVECREGKAEYCLQINVKATYCIVDNRNGHDM